MKTLHDYVAERCDEFGDCLLWKLELHQRPPVWTVAGQSVLIRRVLWELNNTGRCQREGVALHLWVCTEHPADDVPGDCKD